MPGSDTSINDRASGSKKESVYCMVYMSSTMSSRSNQIKGRLFVRVSVNQNEIVSEKDDFYNPPTVYFLNYKREFHESKHS